MKKKCSRCNKIISDAKSATRYCKECAKIVLIEIRRKAGYKHYALHNPHECNKCNAPILPRKHLCEQCKGKRTSMKQLRERLTKLEYQLQLYEKMFKAQDDMSSQNNDKIKELKDDNDRLRQYIDRLQQNENYDSVSLYAKRLLVTNKGRDNIE